MLEYELLSGEKVKAFGNYYVGKKYAEKLNLKLAEYGDVYGSTLSYCYFNKSGNRNDAEEVIIYYGWNNDGKPSPISEDELRRQLFY